jgi:ferredoxin
VPRVLFERDSGDPVEFEVGFGSNVYRAALAHSVPLFNGPMKLFQCWGKGYCGACFVEVLAGAESLPARNSTEQKKLRNAPETMRLACQIQVRGDLVIRKPRGILRPRKERGSTEAAGARGAPDGGS